MAWGLPLSPHLRVALRLVWVAKVHLALSCDLRFGKSAVNLSDFVAGLGLSMCLMKNFKML